jgi:hypothetical protein
MTAAFHQDELRSMWISNVAATNIEVLSSEEDLNASIIACVRKNHRNCEGHTNAESDNKNEKRSCLCWCHNKGNFDRSTTPATITPWHFIDFEDGFLK